MLKDVCKGADSERMIKMGKRIKAAGIKLSVTVLVGLGGRDQPIELVKTSAIAQAQNHVTHPDVIDDPALNVPQRRNEELVPEGRPVPAVVKKAHRRVAAIRGTGRLG